MRKDTSQKVFSSTERDIEENVVYFSFVYTQTYTKRNILIYIQQTKVWVFDIIACRGMGWNEIARDASRNTYIFIVVIIAWTGNKVKFRSHCCCCWLRTLNIGPFNIYLSLLYCGRRWSVRIDIVPNRAKRYYTYNFFAVFITCGFSMVSNGILNLLRCTVPRKKSTKRFY